MSTCVHVNGNKTSDIFFGIALYYGDTYIVTFKNMKGFTMLLYKEIVAFMVILANREIYS